MRPKTGAGLGKRRLDNKDQVFPIRAGYVPLWVFLSGLTFWWKTWKEWTIRSETSRAPTGMRAFTVSGRKRHQCNTIHASLDVTSNRPRSGKEKTLLLAMEHPLQPLIPGGSGKEARVQGLAETLPPASR